MVDGMGVLGYEDVSERRVSVFYGAFVMDTRKMEGVHSRLKGHCGERMMSVEDQVQFTIQQATCNDALIIMFHKYIGSLPIHCINLLNT